MDIKRRPVLGLRWWMAALLSAPTIINFIDRQSLSALAPILKVEYRWTNEYSALIVISFRVAYRIVQGVGGTILDRLGAKRGLSLTVGLYSLIAAVTSTTKGLAGFPICSGLLGAREAPNWPGAIKAVAEWFPAKERAWAVALFDSGSLIGGLLAPLPVLFVYHRFHSWRPVFPVVGGLGFLWLIVWRRVCGSPGGHPRVFPEELAYIRQGRALSAKLTRKLASIRWGRLFKYRQAWRIILGRFLLDRYWYLMSEWRPLFLVSKGFKIE